MHLKNVKVRNFRSFWSEKPGPSAELELCSGVNYLAGPNNVGKSNLLRALAFALDPKAYPYNPEADRPQGWRSDTQSTVTLEFDVGLKPRGPVATLVRYVDEYETSVPGFGAPSLASRGLIQLHVQAWEGNRLELFLAAKAGARKGDDQKLTRALQQLRKVVRFVDIRSGEDLESLLKRGFKEILGTVIGEEHSSQMEAARKARDAYISALGQVLRPLSRHVQERIQSYVRDVKDVDLLPNVPELEDAIAGARFVVEDSAKTGLEQKGTGVRGATLLMLLSFIAESSRRTVVLAVEEPESFLHPEAHRALGDGLEQFARRDEVSLLVTTHSPFIFRKEGDRVAGHCRLFHVRKQTDGRTFIEASAPDIVRVGLVGSAVLAGLLDKADLVSDSARLILVVEGWTDRRYLELAAQKLGISLEGIAVQESDGAIGAAFQAVTARGLHPNRPVSALFDEDEEGKRGQSLLTGKKWQKGSQVLSYRKWGPTGDDGVAIEAEDLFPNELIERFLEQVGRDGHYRGQAQRKSGLWHYDLTDRGKVAFVEWLADHGSAADFERWRALIEDLHAIAANFEKRAAQDAARAQ